MFSKKIQGKPRALSWQRAICNGEKSIHICVGFRNFWCKLMNKLAYLQTPFVKPWLMNNKQKNVQLGLGNIISWILEPAALCMHSFAMLMPFSSLLAHPTSQQYDTQQSCGEGGLCWYDAPISFKYDINLNSTIRKLEIPGKCHCPFPHN